MKTEENVAWEFSGLSPLIFEASKPWVIECSKIGSLSGSLSHEVRSRGLDLPAWASLVFQFAQRSSRPKWNRILTEEHAEIILEFQRED